MHCEGDVESEEIARTFDSAVWLQRVWRGRETEARRGECLSSRMACSQDAAFDLATSYAAANHGRPLHCLAQGHVEDGFDSVSSHSADFCVLRPYSASGSRPFLARDGMPPLSSQ